MDTIAAIGPALSSAGSQDIQQVAAPADMDGDAVQLQSPDPSETQAFDNAVQQTNTSIQPGAVPEFQAAMPMRERSVSADIMRKLDIQVAEFDKNVREINTTTVSEQNGNAHHDHSASQDDQGAFQQDNGSEFKSLVMLLQQTREATMKQSLVSISMDFVNNSTGSVNKTFNDLLKGQ